MLQKRASLAAGNLKHFCNPIVELMIRRPHCYGLSSEHERTFESGKVSLGFLRN